MKNDLISRQDALNFKATITGVRSGKTAILKLFEAYQDYIKSLPPAQPEIIRCKDCKYNATSKKCLNPNSLFLVPADDDFCSYAERRTNATD